MPLNVVLYQPEIPPNTGNIMRLCANTGARLHLIEPLGFELDDARLKRAGLDYREYADVHVHDSLQDCIALSRPKNTIYALSTRGTTWPTDARFSPDDFVIFGPETRGLPTKVLTHLAPDRVLRIPMLKNSRSLNLSNAVSVVVYEAWRQLCFPGTTRP
ncbi:MAG: tRNA (uridine(34)/cytosine(34)/5-carboxymethylaminomethyluridine(34)-2'-O)-methyltransferase TrmL [Pseudomonadales bacterium]|jgi:tRNA (cytidine/uridine-2'-O-)-methyltransferase|nr:tRNA (uridine(34)/cytosine(34)/5-carboxymethylaminomethyluridine(34)-2'-O)-methyltransferase TrmL [Pseudomonadales bacterium]MDP6471770.1 tRNA (uridine(34)/cytosine(34)/5-carboxymethylaminomethyluridine(34)-2'-O)-methyltransferase TrmL [Pseudomonadales bacterium]MDP6828816.1 tRNA (uridine(34)/cytosine(34)/5-carboxymethylaminomethyluridine(34)-2'-O)-methyltransferase TrmL [Pseudomonadales bacterium]|tara:strand:- start:245 stop:721 length:477 start_codon:yes stop_codon:yes gene_type:complete